VHANDDDDVYGRNDVQNELHEDDDGVHDEHEYDGRYGHGCDDVQNAGMRRDDDDDDEIDARNETNLHVIIVHLPMNR
jgi:hypothetical protein